MWNTINIINYCKPKYVVWENVKNLLSKKHIHNFEGYLKELETLGYNNYYQVLNAKDYGIPQNRERVYTVSVRKDIDTGNFKFPKKEELKLRLKDILEKEVEEKYYLSDKMISYISERGTGTYKTGKATINKEVASSLNATMTKMHRAGVDNYVTDNINIIGTLEMDKWQDHMKRIYGTNGISPTISTYQGGNTEPKILEKSKLKYIGSIKDKDIVGNKKRHLSRNASMGDRVYDSNGIATTQSAVGGGVGGNTGLYKVEVSEELLQEFRIRKLTPKECWRLMGFADKDIDKCIAVGISNSQLYKQAGNSIVVPVLEKIFQNLFKEEK